MGEVAQCTIPQGATQYTLEGGWIIPGIISSDSTVGMNEVRREREREEEREKRGGEEEDEIN